MSRTFLVEDSESIHSFNYNKDTSVLEITLKSNPDVQYAYENVARETFLNFIDAPSMGSFYAKHIKVSRGGKPRFCSFISSKNTKCSLGYDHDGAHKCASK